MSAQKRETGSLKSIALNIILMVIVALFSLQGTVVENIQTGSTANLACYKSVDVEKYPTPSCSKMHQKGEKGDCTSKSSSCHCYTVSPVALLKSNDFELIQDIHIVDYNPMVQNILSTSLAPQAPPPKSA